MLRVPLEHLVDGERELSDEASRYLLRVHRMRTGDSCVGFDPAQALEADVDIIATSTGRARVRLSRVRGAERVARRPLVLIQGLAKGSKVDTVVRGATELGATEILLVRCERSVKQSVDLARCRRVALEAARQSGRGDMPTVQGPLALDECLAPTPGLAVVLQPGAQRSFADVVADNDDEAITLLIGPEGGLTSAELARADAAGFVPARLGAFVLRTETAGLAALGAIAARAAALS